MIFFTISTIFLVLILKFVYDIKKSTCSRLSEKNMYEQYYNITNTWVKIKNDGLGLENYFYKNDIKTVAIYAAGELGTRVYEELKNTNIEIKYFTDKKVIDNNAVMEFNGISIVNINNYKEKNEVDAIIVTPTFYMESIEKYLKKSGITKPIISLEKIISDLHNTIN
ncbi:hypothetical protein FDB64_14085 [Clostridium botulinum]|uniref:hypothetical protein n=1 Tax=Clostridium botulinum TaxID=1491 RepID=UPI0013F0BADB|nr:hypothetical protein [Clostridium botulinum]MBY6916659.1 hypothetical protein [Clostridium botulinum]NFL36177.1 hypothetical protein [Clostridium botulinum]NFM04796.1 hypothetical protein [Clostridium botulinum]NFO41188.1 hypothetical protein [Clostridium botulinum]NFQ39385.1 hypothetical protein [Clostridium botulinum]